MSESDNAASAIDTIFFPRTNAHCLSSGYVRATTAAGVTALLLSVFTKENSHNCF
jgi:hypothetical protein